MKPDSHLLSISAQIVLFQTALVAWGQEHRRPFPWRYTDDPYRVLMAEVMLHRTRAEQVEPVYKNFLKRYPDLQALYTASKAELQALLYPLGLRWRVDLIAEMSVDLVNQFEGHIPQSKESLLSLPGVSDYIARPKSSEAVASRHAKAVTLC